VAEAGAAFAKEDPMPDMTAAAPWQPVSTGIADPETWGTLRRPVSAAYHTGALRAVEYRRGDETHRALIIYVYPYWEGDHFRAWSVGLSSELLHGRDPADPVGTFIWSSCRDRRLPQQYPDLSQADGVAARIVRLLAAVGFTAVDRAYPGVMAWLLDRDDLVRQSASSPSASLLP
jgi:hypothetical protein